MTHDTVTAYVGLGSNTGNRAANLLLAVRGLLEAGFCVNRLSAIYETEPHHVPNQNLYLNMAAEIRVGSVTAEQMLARMLRIEYLLGRRRASAEKTARTVDLDLLFFGDKQHRTALLTVPHPLLHQRKFVLQPLSEIAPQLIHPVFGVTVKQLLKQTDDQAQVVRWQPGAHESLNA